MRSWQREYPSHGRTIGEGELDRYRTRQWLGFRDRPLFPPDGLRVQMLKPQRAHVFWNRVSLDRGSGGAVQHAPDQQLDVAAAQTVPEPGFILAGRRLARKLELRVGTRGFAHRAPPPRRQRRACAPSPPPGRGPRAASRDTP